MENREQQLSDEVMRFLERQPAPAFIVNLRPMYEAMVATEITEPGLLDDFFRENPQFIRRLLSEITIIKVNASALHTLESPNEADFCQNYAGFFADDSLLAMRTILLKMFSGEVSPSGIVPVYGRKGRKVYVQFYMQPLRDDDVGCVICNFFEINHWKRAEAALDREQNTLMGSPIFSFRWRNAPGWPVESVSPNIIQLGYSQDDLLSGYVPFSQMIHREDLQRVAEEVAGFSAEGRDSFEQDYRIVTAAGEVRWFYDHTSIVRDNNGDIAYYDGFLVDVTARKLTEKKLEASQREMSSILDTAPVGIWLQDMKGKLRFVNREFCEAVGIREEQFLSVSHYKEIYPEDIAECCMSSDRMALASKDPISTFEKLPCADGQIHEFEIIKARLNDDRGNASGLIGISLDVTERRRAEEALRNSEMRYQEIFETNPVSIWVEDISQVVQVYEQLRSEGVSDFRRYFTQHPEKVFELAALTKVIDVNAATVEMFEAESKQQLLGALDRVFVAESLIGAIEVHAALAEKKRVFEVETINQTLNGRFLHVLIKMNLAEDPDYSNILVSMVDISGRKQMEEKLAESESELATIFDNMQDTYYRTDADGVIVRTSPGVKTMIGYEANEVIGMRLSSLYADPGKRNTFLQDMADAGGKVTGYNINMIGKDGSPVWVSTSSQFVYNEKGEICGVEGIARDITDIVNATHTLEQSKRRLAEANRIAQLGHYEWDIGTGAIFWSSEIASLLGYTTPVVPSLELFIDHVHPDDRERVKQENEKAMTVPGLHSMVYRVVTHDGRERTLESRGEVTFNEETDDRRMIGTVRDITQQQKEQEELSRARDTAEQANRLKGDFLANMSHEIRTPMNGVVGFVNLLSRTQLDSEQRDYVETVKTAMADLMVIVNDILDFSRIESNRLIIRDRDFDLLESVSDVVALFSVMAREKGVELNMRVASDVPMQMKGDPVRLRQVLSNLVGNAVKFTEEGEVQLSVQVLEQNGDNFLLNFEVSDTGLGVPEAERDKLFSAFSQLHGSVSGGAGLGLAISHRLLELMGGKITQQAREGGGSVFSFTLPLVRLQQDSLPQMEAKEPGSREYKNVRVLVVDDNAINRKLVTTLLGKMAVQCREAEDGSNAVNCFGEESFDMVLMDIRMPVMDGMEATRQIRQREDGRRTPIIALTAHALPHERETFILSGMDDCLTKPIKESDLLNVLQRHLGT